MTIDDDFPPGILFYSERTYLESLRDDLKKEVESRGGRREVMRRGIQVEQSYSVPPHLENCNEQFRQKRAPREILETLKFVETLLSDQDEDLDSIMEKRRYVLDFLTIDQMVLPGGVRRCHGIPPPEGHGKIESNTEPHIIADFRWCLGFITAEFTWRFGHGEAAEKHYEDASAKKQGGRKGGGANADKFRQLKERCLSLCATAYAEKGFTFIAADISFKATTIWEIALRDCPEEFTSPQGGPLAYSWFLKTLEDFKADGLLDGELERVCKI